LGGRFINGSGALRGEGANVYLDVIASAAKQSILSLRGKMDCFALLCFALLCFALLCFALLCFALLCFALLRFARNDGRGSGLLRGACHRARIRATRWLAMTVSKLRVIWLFEN
jgi:hypothetical protein